jgi:CDP-diacylglycerol--glycerol-3-phosphate 3-phosphatidyltransferase
MAPFLFPRPMALPAPLRQLPNQLTVARIAAVPVLCLFIAIDVGWLRWLALLIYVAAAITDWLDGYLARRMNMQSDLGRMLDPIADKLLVGLLIVTFAFTRDFSGLDLVPALAILFREIFISGLREFMGKREISVPVTFLAKWKTTAQLVALFFTILGGLLPDFWIISSILLWVAGILTVWTGWQYLVSVWPYFSAPTP